MTDGQESPVVRLHRDALERLRGAPLPVSEPPTIDLPEEPPDAALAAEWRLFRQEVARLLAEGQLGRFALVKADTLTVWDTLGDAARAARLLFGAGPCLVQEIRSSLRPLVAVGTIGSSPCRLGEVVKRAGRHGILPNDTLFGWRSQLDNGRRAAHAGQERRSAQASVHLDAAELAVGVPVDDDAVDAVGIFVRLGGPEVAGDLLRPEALCRPAQDLLDL